MYARHDGATGTVRTWLANDPDNFYFAQKLVNEWQDEGSDVETILSDLASYVTETLDEANPYSVAGRARESLSDANLASVDWSAILDWLNEE